MPWRLLDLLFVVSAEGDIWRAECRSDSRRTVVRVGQERLKERTGEGK